MKSLAPCTTQDIIPFIKKFGEGSMSYSALQEGMQWFFVPGKGFIQFEPTDTVLHRAVVLGDPICAAEDREEILDKFMHEFPFAVFIHVSEDFAPVLSKHGHYVNHMGVETVIDIKDFNLEGKKKEFLRGQKNRATKEGVKVFELGGATKFTMDDLQKISDQWMHQKAVHDHELAFLVRPAVFSDEFDVRKFIAVKDDKVLGFVFFDPMYRDGKIYGYIANILRSLGEQNYSVTDFIIMEAMNKFRDEGVETLSLGLSPFHAIEDEGQFNYSKALHGLYAYAYEHANYLYSFKSLAFHKDRYRPGMPGARNEKVYSATKFALPLVTLYGIFRKMGIHPTRQTAEHAVHCAEEKAKHVAEEMAKHVPEEFKRLLQHWKHPAPDA